MLQSPDYMGCYGSTKAAAGDCSVCTPLCLRVTECVELQSCCFIKHKVLRGTHACVYAGVQQQYPAAEADQSAQPSGGSSPEVDLLSNESISWHQHSDEEEDLAG